MSTSDRVRVSVRGLAFTGDVRLGVEVYECLRKLPREDMSPIVSGFFMALHEDLHRIYLAHSKKDKA